MVRFVAALALFALVSGCAVRDAEIAERARTDLIGMKQTDLRMCAGHPTNEDKYPGGEIWMYEHGVAGQGGLTVAPVLLPLAGAQIGQNGGGYCRVQLRMVKSKVTEVSYAGATDLIGGRDAVCAPIVRNCLDYRRAHP